MGLAYVNRANSGCDYHRVELPLKYLPDVPRAGSYKTAKVVFYNRLPLESLPEFLAAKKRFGFKSVVDIDDYWHLYPEHRLYDAWRKEEVSKKIEQSIYSADAVTCTNIQLAKKIVDINPNVHIIPNALPFDEGQFVKAPSYTGRPRILYAGGCSHYHDLKMVADEIVYTCNERNVEFRLAGYNANEPEWLKIRSLFKGIRPPLFSIAQIQSTDRYMKVYDGSTVVIAPLIENEFNKCKSNLKILEAGAKGLPIICSGIETYISGPENAWNTGIEYFNKPSCLFEEVNWGADKILGHNGELLGEHVRTHYHLKDINKLRESLFLNLMN